MNSNSLTEGKITKSIILFAIPLFIGNVFQQFYNVADTAIIGHVLGDHALAAIGASASLYSLVIGFAHGITNGFAVIIARYFGAKDEKRLRRTVAWTYALSTIVAVTLTILSLVFLQPILVALKTPDDIIGETQMYLRIVLGGAIVTCFYNMFAAMMRAIGNSRTPLYFLILASAINVALDILFVKYLNMGINGAAIATVIAQVISVLLCVVCICKKYRVLVLSFNELRWDKELITELSSLGMSMGLMIVVVSIGSVALQSAVNSLGSDIIAAHITARKVDEIFMLPLSSISIAASTFASQNLGAGKKDRIKKGILRCIMIDWVWSLFAAFVVFLFGRQLIYLISGTGNSFVLDTANQYIKINISFFMILSVLLVLRSSLQGLSRKLVPIMGSVVELIFKFGAVGIITRKLGYFGVCILEPVIWCVCALMVLWDYMRYLKSINDNAKITD